MDTFSSTLNVTLYLSVSSPGITPANVSLQYGTVCVYPPAVHVMTACNLQPGPDVNATQVTPDELSFSIPEGVMTGTTEWLVGPIYINIHAPGTYIWTAQAVGVPVP